jgi:hypothetical protein
VTIEDAAIRAHAINSISDHLGAVSREFGHVAAGKMARAYLLGLQIWIKNNNGPRAAYEALQRLADDVAEKVIRS